MQVNKIGIKNRYIIPAIVSIPLMVSSACNSKTVRDEVIPETEQNTYVTQPPKESTGKGLLFPGAGLLYKSL